MYFRDNFANRENKVFRSNYTLKICSFLYNFLFVHMGEMPKHIFNYSYIGVYEGFLKLFAVFYYKKKFLSASQYLQVLKKPLETLFRDPKAAKMLFLTITQTTKVFKNHLRTYKKQ